MKMVLFEANSRGRADHGWLESHHTFGFAGYYNPERMGFGALRVINDDVVQPSKGFGTHDHDNMEIVSIPLRGALRHQDTMGNKHVIKKGEVQVMSAGTGVSHSEHNDSDTEDVNFLQIWVLPKKKQIEPRYAQAKFSLEDRNDQLQLVVSPDGRNRSLEINQDAFFSQLNVKAGKNVAYQWFQPENCLYVFLLEGSVKVGDHVLQKRDGVGITDTQQIDVVAERDSEVLFMEVPAQGKI